MKHYIVRINFDDGDSMREYTYDFYNLEETKKFAVKENEEKNNTVSIYEVIPVNGWKNYD